MTSSLLWALAYAHQLKNAGRKDVSLTLVYPRKVPHIFPACSVKQALGLDQSNVTWSGEVYHEYLAWSRIPPDAAAQRVPFRDIESHINTIYPIFGKAIGRTLTTTLEVLRARLFPNDGADDFPWLSVKCVRNAKDLGELFAGSRREVVFTMAMAFLTLTSRRWDDQDTRVVLNTFAGEHATLPASVSTDA